MSVTDYSTKVKEICDALGSINVTMDEDEMVQINLSDLTQRYEPIRTTIFTREKPLSFFDLQSMLMVEENHASGSRTTDRTTRCCTYRRNGPEGVEDEVGQLATVAAYKSRKEGIEEVRTTVSDPPLARGVKATPKIDMIWQDSNP